MNEYRPLPAFHFRVLFKGLKGAAEADTRFRSVSGIGLMPDAAAGNETGVAKTVAPVIAGPLVLRRAVSSAGLSPLREWVLTSLNDPPGRKLPEVLIQVLDEQHKPVRVIRLRGIMAAGWQTGELNAEKSELLMEEIWLRYQSVELV